MGNTPSQQPFENDSQEGVASATGASLTARAVRAVRSLVASCRRLVMGKPPSRSGSDAETETPTDEGADGPSEPAPPARPDTVDYRCVEGIPARETPFTHPGDGDGDRNGPDLQATESDDRLAIYYPNCPGATIESDTWERVER